MMKKILCLLLAVVMAFGLVACANTGNNNGGEGNNGGESVEGGSENKEPVTITLYPTNANVTSGKVGGWLGDYLLSKGFILDIWAYSPEKMGAMLSSGNLPDILYIPSGGDFETISESGLLLDLDPYMDKLTNVGDSDQEIAQLNYVRDYVVSDGVMNLLPLGIGGETKKPTNAERKSIQINWELYKEIGYPEFSNLEEFVDVLKQMKAIHPYNEDGSDCYGMHLFNSMDTSYFYGIYNVFGVTGHDIMELPYFLEIDYFNESYDYILADDSMYKYGMKYLNTLYREKLLDPDSINTERAAQHTMLESGGALAGWAAVPGWSYGGYQHVYFDEYKAGYSVTPKLACSGACMGISAQTQNLDAVLEFVNLMADPDAVLVFQSGPQGEFWDVDENGELFVTDKAIDWYVYGAPAKFSNGETFKLFNMEKLGSSNAITSYGCGANMASHPTIHQIQDDTDEVREWKELYGAENMMELTDGRILTATFYDNVAGFCKRPTDDQSLIISAAKDIIVNNSWRMVYAKTDAEFDAIWNETVTDCEALGIKDIVSWRLDQLEKAAQIRDSLAK